MCKTVKTFEEGTWEPSKSIHPEGIGVDLANLAELR